MDHLLDSEAILNDIHDYHDYPVHRYIY